MGHRTCARTVQTITQRSVAILASRRRQASDRRRVGRGACGLMVAYRVLTAGAIAVALAVAAWAAEPPLPPLPKSVPSPEDNPSTAEKVSLGKQLFFDQRLSGSNRMSCATCHRPDKAFADGMDRSRGEGGKRLARNTPTVLNTAYFEKLFWDSRADSLEAQALFPIQNPDEMNQDLDELERELAAIPDYVQQFQTVFGTGVNRQGIAQALAAFQRTLVSGPSPVDRYLAGDTAALSPSARRGLELFVGDAGCIRCHNGPLLSDGKLYRIGPTFDDRGLEALTGEAADAFKFRTPSLRNVAETGPYMHDGSLATLTDVVTYYYRGVPFTAPGGQPLDVVALQDRSFSEIADLVAFLKALSSEVPKVEPPKLP